MFYVICVICVICGSSFGQQKLADEVKTEFLHAWNGYKKYAWGHDDLKPLSKTPHDWYGQSLLMTPVDALDTMRLMGLNDEAAATQQYILANLVFDKDIEVQNFEITIRLLGGLLSNYQLSGDKRFLTLADDLGKRLLPVFNSPTGMPYRYVNLKTGKTRDAKSNPAEIGTLLVEFGTLSKLTGKAVYYDKAKRAVVELFRRRSKIGLVGEWINVETGEWVNTDSHISGAIDSYYEYLLKCWLLFGDADCKRMWDESFVAIKQYLEHEFYRRVPGSQEIDGYDELWYGHADMNTGERRATTYGALDAFFPAVLVLADEEGRAVRLQNSSVMMWRYAGVEPEEFNYVEEKIISPGYPLRPEIVESTYYLYHYTKDPRYLRMGELLWRAFVRFCRTDDAYAALKDVVSKEKADSMQSFVFAETFKYFYLLFAPPETLDFDKVIFNTEAHPIKRFTLLQVQQAPTLVQRDDPDVLVQKFTWDTIHANNDLIHSALDPGPTMNEPVGIQPPPRANEPQEVKNRRDMNERRADMAATVSAGRTNPPRQDQYLLHLQLKNVGTSVIKSVVWEYQPSSEVASSDLRQYVCTMKAKPQESKAFEIVSPYNPVKVVQADAKTGDPRNGKVVINRIEYADGSIWKRKGWSVLIPPEFTDKMGNGKCVAF